MKWYDDPINVRMVLFIAGGIFFAVTAVVNKKFYWQGGAAMGRSTGRASCGILALLLFLLAILVKLGVLTVSY